MHFQTSWLRKTDPLSLLYVVCTSRQAHNTKRGRTYYSLINIKIKVYFVAIRFSRRRLRYQIDHIYPLVLLLN